MKSGGRLSILFDPWLCWLFAAMGALLALLLVRWLRIVALLNQNIPVQKLFSDYLTAVVWAAFLALVLLCWPLPHKEKNILAFLWIAKSAVTLIFMLFYESYYSDLDAFDYFQDSLARASPATELIGDGTQNVSYLAWLHHLILPGSYHALKVSWAMIGLVAIYFFYKAASVYLGRPAYRFLICVGLFPSVLFWSSILGKDPISLLGIAIYSYGVIGWSRSSRRKFLGLIALGILLATMIRLWLGPILILPLCVFVVRSDSLTTTRKMIVVIGITLCVAAFISILSNQFGIEYLEDAVAKVGAISQSWAIGGSAQELPFEIDSVGSLIKFMPIGGFTALFRPLPGEVSGAFGLLAGLENLVLLAGVVWGLHHIRLSDLRNPTILWAILLIAFWTVEYAVVSYQNLGSGARFKLQILPILLGLILHFGFRTRKASSH
jgi:hypothetical protein